MVLTSSMALALHEAPRVDAMPATAPPPTPGADLDARRLSAAVAKGDAEAFRELYDRYSLRLLRFLMVLSRGDEALSRDVVQQSMLTAAGRLKPLQTEAHLWNWLARVAHQHLIKAWRPRHRSPVLVELPELPDIPAPAAADAHLEQSLDAALRILPESDRQLVEWFYFDHLTHGEIAQRLDTTAKAISRRLERTRMKLRLSLRQILAHET